MIKVLHVTKRYPPYIGGIETVCHDVCKALNGKYEQMVLAFNDKNETIEEEVDGIKVIRASVFKVVASQPLSKDYGKLLDNIFKTFKPDIIHFDYPNPYSAAFLLRCLEKYKFKGKFLLFWHMDIVKQKILRSLFVPQTKKLLKIADLVVATSPNYLKDTSFLPDYKGKIDIIPLRVGDFRTTLTPNQIEESEKIKKQFENKKIIFFYGRHVKYKGLTYLIDADKYLNQDECVILIAGKGKLTNELKQQAKDFKNIKFMGVLSDDQINSYLNACDIFAFPSISRNEAFGISLAEALYFGKPAVTFKIKGSGVNFVSLNNVSGLETSNLDSKEYANNLNLLMHDMDLYQRLSKGARQRALNYFQKETFEKKILDAFASLK